MKAVITGENDRVVGINLLDNNDVEHVIEMEFNGRITGHEQDGYPDDPSKRTSEGNEHVNQARKFAQYYVYQERGYDTVEAENHPERINAVRLALKSLSDAQYREFFGDFYQQMASYHRSDTDQVVPIPPDAPGPNTMFYRQNIYLGVDPLETDIAAESRGLATAYDVDIDELAEKSVRDVTDDELSRWESFFDDLTDLIPDTGTDLSDSLYLDSVSSVYGAYVDGDQYEVGEPETDPLDREPDAVLEMPPIDPGTFEQFRVIIDRHLKCQVRDAFVRMGVRAPEEFRVVGNGRLGSVVAYKFVDFYPKYYDSDELDSF